MIMTMMMVLKIIMEINEIRLARPNSKPSKIKSGLCLKLFAVVLSRCLLCRYLATQSSKRGG